MDLKIAVHITRFRRASRISALVGAKMLLAVPRVLAGVHHFPRTHGAPAFVFACALFFFYVRYGMVGSQSNNTQKTPGHVTHSWLVQYSSTMTTITPRWVNFLRKVLRANCPLFFRARRSFTHFPTKSSGFGCKGSLRQPRGSTNSHT